MTKIVKLADGTRKRIPDTLIERFRGLDEHGNWVVADSDQSTYLYPLTPCCHATGTGTDYGTACRNCYRLVGWYFGGEASVTPGKEVVPCVKA